MTTVSDVYGLLDLILKIPPEILRHQRIGQILTNAADDIDLYYFSNDELLGLLEKYVNTLRKDAAHISPETPETVSEVQK